MAVEVTPSSVWRDDDGTLWRVVFAGFRPDDRAVMVAYREHKPGEAPYFMEPLCDFVRQVYAGRRRRVAEGEG